MRWGFTRMVRQRRARGQIGIVAVLAAILLGAAPQSLAACVPIGFDQMVEDLIARTNHDRWQAGLPPLLQSPELSHVAMNHACDMHQRRYFSHTDQRGASAPQRVHEAGFRSCWTGENIAMGQRSAAQVHRNWMASAGHRENIMRPDYAFIGIGISGPNTERARKRWVAVFAKPC